MGSVGDRPGDEVLPDELTRPSSARDWDLPTAWLLGTQLTASVRDMIASGLTEADVRDWMDAGPPIRLEVPADEDAIWIDFLADTGDSPLLVHRLAHLLLPPSLTVHFAQDGDRPVPPPLELPRGRALVIGGDTAYPVADADALLRRMRAPFVWARQDLRARGVPLPHDVPLVGIPGNHDLYNTLAGHVRVFRADPTQPLPAPTPPAAPAVTLPGYVRVQHASYFALDLPFDWQLWGLDVEFRRVDDRQAAYFRSLTVPPESAAPGWRPPARIVVSSRPAVVYHGASHHAAELAATFERCGLGAAADQPFLRDGVLPSDELRLDLSGDVHTYERYWGRDGHGEVAGDAAAAALQMQLDAVAEPVAANLVSERPAADRAGVANRPIRASETPETPQRANYASVVSGLGGAFHHPGQVRLGDRPPRRSWPRAADSVRAIGARLLRPMAVFQAGAVGIAGAVVAILCLGLTYLAYRDAHESQLAVRNLLELPLRPAPRDLQPVGHALWIAGAVVGALVAAGALVVAIAVARWLRRGSPPPPPEADLIAPSAATRAWRRVDRFVEPRRAAVATAISQLTHRPAVRRLTAVFGANRDNVVAVLVTLPVWLALVALWSTLAYAAFASDQLHHAADGFVPLYAVTTLLLLAMLALGWQVAPGHRTRTLPASEGPRRLALPTPWATRIAFTLLALLIGALIVWLPYAWTRAATAHGWDERLLMLLVVFAYRPTTPLSEWILRWRVRRRRAGLAVMFLALVAGYVAVPIAFHPSEAVLDQSPRPYTLLLVGYFGAYFTCLLIGWYFLLCLQWNGHGNEAGGAARVVDYAEFVRIKLSRDRAEVYVIAVANQAPGGAPPAPRWRRLMRRLFAMSLPAPADHVGTAELVDHFTIARHAAGTASSSHTR